MANMDYQARVAQQVAQYATSEIHDVPPIYDYWSNTHLRPRLNAVLGVDTIPDFYVQHIRQRAARAPHQVARILSIGAGDAEIEIQIAKQLLSSGLEAFRLEGMELSPILIERANQRIQEAGLAAHLVMVESDLNSWKQTGSSGEPYTAVLANHILHHVVELEALFANVAAAIGDTGVFLTADMIGRNGHQRWPEVLSLVNALWETLPKTLKYNHVFCETDEVYKNWDCCSPGGFEGIRAQDILPLLLQHFQFEKFLAFGGLPEAFCNRDYGPNYDPAVPAHTAFVDSVDQMNSLLLELGAIKPTMMFAVLSNHGVPAPSVWKNLSPEFCLRDPTELDLSRHRQQSQSLATAYKPDLVSFRQGEAGERSLRAGWSYPEDWGTWMVGKEAVLEVAVPAAVRDHGTLMIRMRASAFLPRRLYSRSFTFQVGDAIIGGVTFYESENKSFDLEMTTPESSPFLLRIIAHEDASPADEGSSGDARALGLALVDLGVY
jgi:2-polyprenyl-3-methyl-5-hydroxy-6-metoxy-1,4-benzoquinol methylase